MLCRVGDYATVLVPECDYSRKGTIVHIFLANIKPDEDLIQKYYGDMAPRSAFRALRVDRIVVEYAVGYYLIVPVGSNRCHISIKRGNKNV